MESTNITAGRLGNKATYGCLLIALLHLKVCFALWHSCFARMCCFPNILCLLYSLIIISGRVLGSFGVSCALAVNWLAYSKISTRGFSVQWATLHSSWEVLFPWQGLLCLYKHYSPKGNHRNILHLCDRWITTTKTSSNEAIINISCIFISCLQF